VKHEFVLDTRLVVRMRKITGLWLLACAVMSIFLPGSALAASNAPVINEVQCHGNDWIELKNPSTNPIDLSGWALTDKKLKNAFGTHLFVFPAGVSISAGEYLVIEQKGVGEKRLTFGIPCSGGQSVSLLRPAIPGPFELVSRITIPQMPKHTTYGRVPDGKGAFRFTTSSKGKLNFFAKPKYLGPKNFTCRLNSICRFSLRGSTGATFGLTKGVPAVLVSATGSVRFGSHNRGNYLIPVKLTNTFGQVNVLVKVLVK